MAMCTHECKKMAMCTHECKIIAMCSHEKKNIRNKLELSFGKLRASFDLPGSYCIFVYFVFFTLVGGLKALVK